MAANPLIITPDQKVRVFLSSRIGEFASERRALVKMIQREGWQPIFFEELPRPHPPRELYKAYLEQSEIFVGFYGTGYGWIDSAGGMTISGIHDEWNLAKGKDRIVLVKADAGPREARLDSLLDEIGSSGVSYSQFRTQADLVRLVRDAVRLNYISHGESATSSGICSRRPPRNRRRQASVDGICRTRLVAGYRCASPDLSAWSIWNWEDNCLAASELTTAFDIYISLRARSGIAVLTHIAARLASLTGRPTRTFSSLDDAYAECEFILRTYTHTVALLVDDVDEAPELAAQLSTLPFNHGRLVMAGNGVFAGFPRELVFITCEGLNDEEAADLIGKLRPELEAPARAEVVAKASQNPLYLRYFSLSPSALPLDGLRAYQHAIWSALSRDARELVAHIAGSESEIDHQRLARALTAYRASCVSGLSVQSECDALSHLLSKSSDSLELFHPSFRDFVNRQIASDGLAKGVHEALASSYDGAIDEPVRVYHMVRSGKVADVYHQVLGASAWSQLTGRMGTQRTLLGAVLLEGRRRRDSLVVGRALYAAALLAQHTRHVRASYRLIQLAEKTFSAAASSEWRRIAEAAKATILVEMDRGEEAEALLQQLRDYYISEGISQGEGLARVNLSYTYIRLGRFAEAAYEASAALPIFRSLSDRHGMAVALLNLNTSQLVGIDKREQRKSLSRLKVLAGQLKSPRFEAAVLNCETILHRRAERYDEAKIACQRSIDIARSLGDWSLLAINTMNLGNVFRDQDDHVSARQCYEETLRVGTVKDSPYLIAAAKHVLADLEEEAGDIPKSIELGEGSLQLWRQSGNVYEIGKTAGDLADRYASLGDVAKAAMYHGEAARAWISSGLVTDTIDAVRAAVRSRRDRPLPRDIETSIQFLRSLLPASETTKTLPVAFVGLALGLDQMTPDEWASEELNELFDYIGTLYESLAIRQDLGGRQWIVFLPSPSVPAVEFAAETGNVNAQAAIAVLALLLFARRTRIVERMGKRKWRELGLSLLGVPEGEMPKFPIGGDAELTLAMPAAFTVSAVPRGKPQPALGVFISDQYLAASSWDLHPGNKVPVWMMLNLHNVVLQHFSHRRFSDDELQASRRAYIYELLGLTLPDVTSPEQEASGATAPRREDR